MSEKQATEVKEIPVDQIDDPVNPMRSEVDGEGIGDLAHSIQKQGLINPITVRPKGDRYEVVAGHRRFAACLRARMINIPCVVRNLSDEEIFGVMIAENIERKEVDPVDESLFLGRLLDKLGWTVEQAAEKVGRSVQWVEDRLGILEYPDYMVAALKQGQIKLGVAKYLAEIEDDVYRRMYVDSAIQHGMSVRQAEHLFRQYDMGVLVPSDQVVNVEPELQGETIHKVRARCARCQEIAESPNLRSVFVHVECPPKS